jgi:predicted KAP-like P-loop ATPase
MKLQPPVVQISPENPYSQDLFNRKDFGDSLSSLISNIEDNIVLCIDAPWGDGKTTFAKMWTADLLRQGKHCIYFDAYEHDYSDDPYVSFCTEIISLAETAFDGISAIQKLKEDFKTKAKRIGGKLLCTGTRIGVKAFTLGIIKDSDIDALSSIKEDLADSSSVAISNYVGKAFDDYASSKESLSDFRAKLTALGAAVKEEQELPLLIVVDELDRCRPDFALSLIERIKHLFSTKNVCFVLLVNLAQLQNYVKTI